VVTGVALGLRLSQVHQGLFGDELFTYSWDAGHHLHVGNSDNPPLFFVLAWLSARLGDPAVLIRLPSVLLGTATVPLVFALGKKTVGALAGLIGAAFVAVNPFAVFYGVEARPYATMVFFVALSTLALVRAIETRSPRWWSLYAAAAAGAAYSHYSSIFVLAAQGGWSLWACRDRLRQPVLANAVAAALYAPWLSHVHGHQGVDIIAYLAPLHAGSPITDLLDVFGGYPLASLREIPTVPLLVALLVSAGAGLATLVYRTGRRRDQASPVTGNLVLLALLAAATPVGLLLYSLLVVNVYGTRQLLASLPALALILGAGLTALPRAGRPLATAVVLGTLITGTAISFSADHRRPDTPGIARFIDARGVSGATVAYVPFFTPRLEIYLSRSLPVTTHPSTQEFANQWRTSSQLFVVAPRIGAHVLAPALPATPQRAVLERREFRGIVTYDVTVYR